MTLTVEKRLLQVLLALGCVVPLLGGAAGMIQGPTFLRGVHAPVATDLDSHLRYLSGLLLVAGLLFASCIPALERKGDRLRLAVLIVFVGGLGRLWSVALVGLPGFEHRVALGLELVGAPLVLVWQMRIARRWRAAEPA